MTPSEDMLRRNAADSRPCPNGCGGIVRFRWGTPGAAPWTLCEGCADQRDAALPDLPAEAPTAPDDGPLTLRLTLPATFLADHLARFEDARIEVVRDGARRTTIRCSRDAAENLAGDAAHYAAPVNGYDDRALVRSAAATVRRLAGVVAA